MAVRKSDWWRLKRCTSNLKEPIPRLSQLYSVLFGAAVSSSLSTIPLAEAQNMPTWVTPLYVVVSFFCFFGGCVFLYLDRKLNAIKNSRADELITEMGEIEKSLST